MTTSDMTLFPMMIKLAGRKCVVIGAGKVAAAKVEGLLSCGARVVVIGPKAVRRIRDRANAGKLVWRRRRFSPHDLRGAFLAIAATDSPSTNESVFRFCQAREVLCNSVDDPEHCDFFYPAVVRRGPVQIAISTSGRSPALAARLRRELGRQFGPEWSAFVERVGRKRQEILRLPQSTQRKRLLKEIGIPSGFRTAASR
jgi:precorrin-2 dehydrogenase/sirohydrochlorin ferrochelatase